MAAGDRLPIVQPDCGILSKLDLDFPDELPRRIIFPHGPRGLLGDQEIAIGKLAGISHATVRRVVHHLDLPHNFAPWADDEEFALTGRAHQSVAIRQALTRPDLPGRRKVEDNSLVRHDLHDAAGVVVPAGILVHVRRILPHTKWLVPIWHSALNATEWMLEHSVPSQFLQQAIVAIFLIPEFGLLQNRWHWETDRAVYAGNSQAAPPHYDFAATLPVVLEPPPARTTLGDPVVNPIFQPEPKPWTECWPWLVCMVLGCASVALLAMPAVGAG